jgi:hypothetical protein
MVEVEISQSQRKVHCVTDVIKGHMIHLNVVSKMLHAINATKKGILPQLVGASHSLVKVRIVKPIMSLVR